MNADTELSGLHEVHVMTGMKIEAVAGMVTRKLFPEPVHHKPPPWIKGDLLRWLQAAAVTVRKRKAR